MPRRRNKATTTVRTVREQLELFVYRAEELSESRLLRYIDTSLQITFTNQKVEFKSSNPDKVELRSFLMTFRQFISNNEPVHIYRIHNVCIQHFTSDELMKRLVEARENWKRNIMNQGCILNLEGEDYTPEELTDCWINGFYFHNDADQFNLLRRLVPHARLLAQSFFLNHMMGATALVFFYAGNIKIALREGLIKT